MLMLRSESTAPAAGDRTTSDTLVVFMPRGKGTLVETLTRQ